MLELKNYLKKLNCDSHKLQNNSSNSHSGINFNTKAKTTLTRPFQKSSNFNRTTQNNGVNNKDSNKPKLCLN
jgi:hypothetical protein